jgi:hypothetical protein
MSILIMQEWSTVALASSPQVSPAFQRTYTRREKSGEGVGTCTEKIGVHGEGLGWVPLNQKNFTLVIHKKRFGS